MFGKNIIVPTLLKQMPNLNLLLTVASDINSVLFALFNPVFVPYIRCINRNLYFSIQIANTSGFRAKQTGKICEGRI
jgi:hypothetical protein